MRIPPGKTVAPTLIERLLYLIGGYAFFFLAYGFANRTIPLSRCHDLSIALDYAIPFAPGFIFFYCFPYLLMLVPVFIINDRVMLQRTILAFFLLIVISVSIFFLFPVFMPRPGFTVDSLATKLVALVYRNDQPVCGFPSLHVSMAVLATAILFRRSGTVGWVFSPFALLTSLSVLFVKQHVVLDFVGGLVLAVVIDRLVMGKWKQAGKGISA
jgi:membrane-associated phospholipid phosphatase